MTMIPWAESALSAQTMPPFAQFGPFYLQARPLSVQARTLSAQAGHFCPVQAILTASAGHLLHSPGSQDITCSAKFRPFSSPLMSQTLRPQSLELKV